MQIRMPDKPKTVGFSARPRAGFAVRIAVALGCGILAAANDAAWAITLDGTSGTNTSNAALSTTGNLQIDLGFFSEYLIVGGGGGGGGNPYSGGGGGGGLLTNVNGAPLQLGAGTFTVTVGGGGTGQANGQNSVFDSLTAVGGGHGGQQATATSSLWPGAAGGSGGGGGGNGTSQNGSGGAGTTGQGRAGGSGFGNNTSTARASGGGGGAGGVGGNASSGVAGNGGNGLANTITGSSVFYAGGGGGGTRDGTVGTGGQGGGGNGGRSTTNPVVGTNGADGLGGGGGGRGSSLDATNGGSGIVIVRYQGSPAGTGGTVTPGTGTALGYTLHTFNAVGTTALDFSGLNLNERLGLTLTSGITGTGNLSFNGPGRLTLASANSYSGTTTVSAGTLALGSAASLASPVIDVASGGRLDVSALTGGLALGSGQRLGGRGTLVGDVAFGSGSQLAFDPLGPLAVSSGTLTFAADFGVANLFGIDWDSVALNTPFSLISTSQTTFGDLANFGFENRTSVGSIGRQAYFESGSLQVIVVPEPSTSPLVAAGLIGLVVFGWRQRK